MYALSVETKPDFATRSTRRWLSLASMLSAIMLAACSGMPQASQSAKTCTASSADTVCTGQGAIRGVVEGETMAFKGIPYAQAPVGNLRWRAPAPPLAWEGVRDGSRFGPVCPQLAGNNVVGEEDCLTLNIWRPRTVQAKPLPVMVFFIGGGNHAFSGQGSPGFGGVNYNGQQLAPEGAVFVSFNSRLGALGYLAHPALDAERKEKVSGNYGNLDQIAMLRWLQQNIAAFGGDPKRVFVFGTSAGGGSICALMTSPMARHLFHAASMQSSVPTGCEIPTLADAEQGTGRLVVGKLGCENTANVAACLRGKSMAEIVQAVPGTFGVLPRIYGPNMDGHVFPDQPLALIKRGQYMRMPVILGSSTEETMLFVNGLGPVTDAASFSAAIAKVFGPGSAARIQAQYPLQAFSSPRQALVKLTTDALFTCQNRRVARALNQSQTEPVYVYMFAHVLENDAEQKALGAVHTIEHAFLFPWQGKYRPTEKDLAVQKWMTAYWTQMAKEGRLGKVGNLTWPAYTTQTLTQTPQNHAYLEISPAPAVKYGPADAHCDFWDSVTLPWPHL